MFLIIIKDSWTRVNFYDIKKDTCQYGRHFSIHIEKKYYET